MYSENTEKTLPVSAYQERARLTLSELQSLCRRDKRTSKLYERVLAVADKCKYEYFEVFLPSQTLSLEQLTVEMDELSNQLSNLFRDIRDNRHLASTISSLRNIGERAGELRLAIAESASKVTTLSGQGEDAMGRLFEPFHNALDELENHLKRRLPFELNHHLIRTAEDEQSNSVSFECGDITDAEGHSIFRLQCYFCSRVIQHGALKRGDIRWSAADSKAHLCLVCFQGKSSLLRLINTILTDTKNLAFVRAQMVQSRTLSCASIMTSKSSTKGSCIFENSPPTASVNENLYSPVLSPWTMVGSSPTNGEGFGSYNTDGFIVEDFLRSLDIFDPLWFETFFAEYDHPIWLRDHNDTDLNELVRGLFVQYQFRPVVCEPTRSLPNSYLRLNDGADQLEWWSFDYMIPMICKLTTYISSIAPSPSSPPTFLVVLSRPCIEWLLIDTAAALLGIPIAACHSSWSALELQQALEDYLGSFANHGTKEVRVLIFCEDSQLELIAQSTILSSQKVSVSSVVVWSLNNNDLELTADQERLFNGSSNGCSIHSLNMLLGSSHVTISDSLDWQLPVIDVPADNTPHLVMFTSGSTGQPKAAVISRAAWTKSILKGCSYLWPLVLVIPSPLYLMGERLGMWSALCNGGRFGFVSDVGDLLKALVSVRPTISSAPPALWTQLLASLLQMDRTSMAYTQELSRVRAQFGGRLKVAGSGGASSSTALLIALNDLFGNREGHDVQAYLASEERVGENYGCTEAGNIASNGVIDPDVQVYIESVPGLTAPDDAPPSCLVRAVRSKGEDDRNISDAIGQVCVKTPVLFSGYVGIDSSSIFTPEGYYRTGDLGQLLPGRRIRLVGRCKTTVKLGDGTFCCPEVIEAALSTGLIDDRRPLQRHTLQAFDSTPLRDELSAHFDFSGRAVDSRAHEEPDDNLAVAMVYVGVIPTSSPLWSQQQFFNAHDLQPRDLVFAVLFFQSESTSSTSSSSLLSIMSVERIQNALSSHAPYRSLTQRPVIYLVESCSHSPSVSNGLLTVSGKLSRPNLATKYHPLALSAYMNQVQDFSSHLQDPNEVASLTSLSTDALMLRYLLHSAQRFCRVALRTATTYDSISFLDMGLDSLGAMGLSSCLAHELCASDTMRVSKVRNTLAQSQLLQALMSMTISAVVNCILQSFVTVAAEDIVMEEAVHNYLLHLCQQSEAASVHTSDAKSPSATRVSPVDDATALSALLLQKLRECATVRVPYESTTEYHQVLLLTGATGFVGAKFLFSLLQGGASSNDDYASCSGICCIVRGLSQKDSETRLVRSLQLHVTSQNDVRIEDLIREAIAAQTLQVLCGDLTEPQFGATKDDYDEIVHKVRWIVHAAAEVKLFADYMTLRAANVLGTYHLLRFWLDAMHRTVLHETTTRAVSFLHISTISILPERYLLQQMDTHDDAVNSSFFADIAGHARALDASDGYALSKWVAEKLCLDLRAALREETRYLMHIARLGYVGWFSTSPTSAPPQTCLHSAITSLSWHPLQGRDWLSRLLLACRQDRVYPTLEDISLSFSSSATSCTTNAPRSSPLSIAPVNEVIAGLRYLLLGSSIPCQQHRSDRPVTHIFGPTPRCVLSLEELCKAAAEAAYPSSAQNAESAAPATGLPMNLWCAYMLRICSRQRPHHPLASLAPLLAVNSSSAAQPTGIESLFRSTTHLVRLQAHIANIDPIFDLLLREGVWTSS